MNCEAAGGISQRLYPLGARVLFLLKKSSIENSSLVIKEVYWNDGLACTFFDWRRSNLQRQLGLFIAARPSFFGLWTFLGPALLTKAKAFGGSTLNGSILARRDGGKLFLGAL
jgi:hypothetical protein